MIGKSRRGVCDVCGCAVVLWKGAIKNGTTNGHYFSKFKLKRVLCESCSIDRGESFCKDNFVAPDVCRICKKELCICPFVVIYD